MAIYVSRRCEEVNSCGVSYLQGIIYRLIADSIISLKRRFSVVIFYISIYSIIVFPESIDRILRRKRDVTPLNNFFSFSFLSLESAEISTLPSKIWYVAYVEAISFDNYRFEFVIKFRGLSRSLMISIKDSLLITSEHAVISLRSSAWLLPRNRSCGDDFP